MFETLARLARSSPKGLTLMISALPDNALSVAVIPQGDFGGDKAVLATPLQVTGTVDELTAGFESALTSFESARKTLEEQLADTVAILDAAKKASAETAKKSLAKPAAKPAKTAPVASANAAQVAGDDDEGDTDGKGEDGNATSPPSTPAVKPLEAKKPDAFALDLG